MKSDEKDETDRGSGEDDSSRPHGLPDGTDHDQLHGLRPDSILRKEITLSNTNGLTAPTSAVGLFFARSVQYFNYYL